ncbi:MAG: TonB-dependent receptor [Pyrinomonadaceae bacterium]
MKFSVLLPVLVLANFAAISQQPIPTPSPILAKVTVTASRTETRIGDTPASVVVLSRREIETSAAPVIDDVLRQAAGFSLFRRSSSRNANPTTQGVSLRGVGSSGASRTVVMFDGVPLNDPFGGWIQWNRVSPIELESIEVLRGGASSLYGDGGLSGAVNLFPQKHLDADVGIASLELFGGTQKTLSGSGVLGYRLLRDWFADASAGIYQTRGYKPVEEPSRGPVDSNAGVRSSKFRLRLARDLGEKGSIFISPSYFGEVRSNGTGLQTNRTHIRQIVFGGDVQRSAIFRWRAYGGTQIYDQIFSAVNATRTSENLTRIQRSPAQNIGLSAQISTVLGQHTLVGGLEARNVRGASDEIGLANGMPASLLGSGGRQTNAGVFVQDLVSVGKLVIVGGVRFDRWQNYTAFTTTHTLSTNQTATTVFPDLDESSLSPRASMLYHLNDRFSLYASASQSFRSPTLNELYRGFRVGNVVTQANENLLAERANNVEGGLTFSKKRTFLRASGFWTSINRPVVNVTLTVTPTLITRQRQNAGKTRSAGIEIEGETAFKYFSLSAGYVYAHPTVTGLPSNPSLVGLTIPQVARHQFTFQARYSHSTWSLAVQGRASSSQFDDDRNQFRLEHYSQFDVFASRQINEDLKIFAAVENIFNSRYSIGKTPIRTIAGPTNLRLGIRWR